MNYAITIPAPPSDNRRLVVSTLTGRRVLSPEYRRWIDSATVMVRSHVNRVGWQTTADDVVVAVDLCVNRRRDIQNCVKGICDVLERGGVYKDDRQVRRLTLSRVSKADSGLQNGEVFVTVAVGETCAR